MLLMIAGLVIFVTIHLVPANRELRDGLVVRFGENGYKGFFTLISLVGLALIVIGYGKMQDLVGSKNPVLWYPPLWTKHVAFLLMIPSFIFLVAAYVPSRIRAAMKHPMLLAVKIWALAHLISNGDIASIVLFSSLLAWAVYDRISLKSRNPLGAGGWDAPILNDVIVVAVGIGLWAAMLTFGHEYLIGVPLLSG